MVGHSEYKKARIFISLVLVVIVIALVGVVATSAQDPPTPEHIEGNRQMLDQWARVGKGAIRLRGEIFDDEGRPLRDVIMQIRTSRPSLLDPLDDGYSRKRKVVTGAFRYKCNRCSTVHLYFSKEGYRHEEVEFVYDRKTHGKKLEATALRIKLDRLRNPVTLVKLGGVLSVGVEPTRVVPISLQPTSSSSPLEWLEEKIKKKGGSSEQLAYLKLEASLHADGTPVTIHLDRPGQPKSRWGQPASAFLDFSKADGGVVLHEPTGSEVRRIFDSMRMAPESGYVSRLPLFADSEAPKCQYFYCKLGNYYCKGRVAKASIQRTENGLVVTTHVRIWLNRDGGRSVESRYH